MSTPIAHPPKPSRNDSARLSEPEDFGPITELGPIEPGVIAENTAQAARTSPADFNPPPHLADQLLEDAANPNIPLLTIAQNAGITLNTLRLWLARPEISEQLDAIESTLRRRARLKVLHELDNITEACATILERFHRAPDRGSTEDRRPDTELRASAIITRNASNALMASRVLLALARYLDGPPRTQRRAQDATAPKTHPAPAPDLNPTLRLTPREQTKAFRLLPSLASIDLHDFREYLTSNHHHNGHTVEELTVPRDVAVGGAPQQPVPTTSDAATSTKPVAAHPQPNKPDKSYPSHGSSSSSPPPPSRHLCTCGPTRCTTCPTASTLLTIAGAQIPRARDPTIPAR